ncbi:hypothetical protein SAMN05216392_0759 [Streptococcus equinus]|uniref:Uncharacterized protein n=2 Tax=Streptococcus equinus TaxID=1335 RepID=A0A1H0YMY8_STREI|nr:hypothetical protein SAMN05216392_0759 [Streptococcus equinus]
MTLNERAETRRETFYKLTNEGALGNLVVESKLSKGWLDANGKGQILGPDAKGERTTDFIQVVAGKTYTFQWWATVSEGQKCWDAWQFYDSNQKPFGSRGGYGEYGSDGEQHGKRTITAPANACYIRLSYRSFGNGHMMFEAGAGSASFEPSFDDSLKLFNRNLIQNTDKPFTMGYGITNTTWDDDKKWAYLDLTDPNVDPAKAAEILPQGQFYNFKPTKGMTYTQSILIDTDATFNPSGQVQNSWFTSQGHNQKRGYFEQLSDTTYRFWSTCTWQLEDIALRAFDWYGLHNVLDFRNSGTYLAFYKPKLESGELVSDYSQAPEDLGWSSTPLVPTQQQRYLWKYEYIYYSDGSVEVTQPVNLSIAGADADTTGVTAAISEIDSKANSLRADLTNVSNSLSNAASQLQAQAAAQTDLTSRVSTVEETANGTKTTVAELTKTVDDNTDDITSITQRTSAIETDLSGAKATLSQVQTTANTTTANLASYQASNDQAVASLQSSLQTTDGNVSSLQTQINAVPGQITSAVSAVEGKIAGSLVGQNLYIKSTSVKGFLPTTGGAALGGQNAVNKEVTSDFIRVNENEKYVFQGWLTVPDGNYSWRAWQYYDVDKQPINNRQTPGFNVTTDEDNVSHFQHIITMPAGVKYIRISARLYSDGKLKFEKGSVATDYSLAPEDTATQISSLSSQIQQTADGMTLLATKTELNTAKTELQSGISTATSKADSAQATANSNAQTISTHTTQISALNTGLQAKVSQSDFDSLSGRVTTAESNLTATANQLSSQISSVNERIPTSKDFKNLYVIANSSDGFLAYGSTNLGAASATYKERTSDYIPVEVGEKYAFQVWTTLTENQQGWRAWQFYNEDKTLNGGRQAGNYTSDYQCVQQTLTVPANAKYLRVSARLYNDGKIMVEKGNVYHDYMLAPEDTISDAALAQAKSEIKQTTDAITASVSSVQTAASNAQATANTAVSKADAAQVGVNTLDSTTVKSASLNLDNNGFVTKVGKTINGNKFATMIAQDANSVKIIADEMQVTANMIVDGAVTANKLNVNNLSAVNSNLGAIRGGSLLLQENKTAGSATDSWGTYNRPAYKQGLFLDNHAFASSGAIQRKNGSETTPTDMPLAVLQAGELRFLVVDYNDNLENVVHYGLSDPDFGAIRFEIDSELKRRLTMTSSGYLNFQASNYTDWTSTGVSGCEYMIQGRLVVVNYDVTFNSAGTHTIGGIPQEFTKKSLMMTAKAWSVMPDHDRNIQLNSDGSLHVLNAEANVNYRGTLVFSY